MKNVVQIVIVPAGSPVQIPAQAIDYDLKELVVIENETPDVLLIAEVDGKQITIAMPASTFIQLGKITEKVLHEFSK